MGMGMGMMAVAGGSVEGRGIDTPASITARSIDFDTDPDPVDQRYCLCLYFFLPCLLYHMHTGPSSPFLPPPILRPLHPVSGELLWPSAHPTGPLTTLLTTTAGHHPAHPNLPSPITVPPAAPALTQRAISLDSAWTERSELTTTSGSGRGEAPSPMPALFTALSPTLPYPGTVFFRPDGTATATASTTEEGNTATQEGTDVSRSSGGASTLLNRAYTSISFSVDTSVVSVSGHKGPQAITTATAIPQQHHHHPHLADTAGPALATGTDMDPSAAASPGPGVTDVLAASFGGSSVGTLDRAMFLTDSWDTATVGGLSLSFGGGIGLAPEDEEEEDSGGCDGDGGGDGGNHVLVGASTEALMQCPMGAEATEAGGGSSSGGSAGTSPSTSMSERSSSSSSHPELALLGAGGPAMGGDMFGEEGEGEEGDGAGRLALCRDPVARLLLLGDGLVVEETSETHGSGGDYAGMGLEGFVAVGEGEEGEGAGDAMLCCVSVDSIPAPSHAPAHAPACVFQPIADA